MKILLVEDNPDDIFLFSEMIRDALGTECEIHPESRLAAALPLLAERHFDVALFDVGLPDSQGEETVETVLAATVSTPVLFLTGNDNEDLAIAAVSHGAQDYLPKGGMTPDLLARAIRYAIEREQLESRIRQMEKMDAIGKLAGGVAHDFNNQLSGIIGYGDMLVDKLEDPKLRGYAEHIVTAARHSAKLAHQMLTFAHKSEVVFAPVDVHGVIQEIVAILDRSIDKRIGIRQQLTAQTATVLGDVSLLQNAILNIGINTRDAMPDGGELLLETRTLQMSEIDCSRLPHRIHPGWYLELRISDTGEGMTPEVQQHIFDPFFTTKGVGEGTGMGLATVYGTVKQHAGAITVYSNAGKGSCFVMLLPLSNESADSVAEGPVDASGLQGTRVLVVDDEGVLRDLVSEMLRDLGCEPHLENDGEAGAAYYRDHAEEIDLVILDMVMPRMGGPECFHAIREVNPEARIVVASGFSAGGEVNELLEAGAIGFLSKPFRQQDLIEMMTAPQS